MEGIRGLGGHRESISLFSDSWQGDCNLFRLFLFFFFKNHSADSTRAHRCWHLYFQNVHSTFSRGVYEDSPSQIHININVGPRFWNPRLGVRALIQPDACLRNQMMSLWWHVANGVPNADAKFNFPCCEITSVYRKLAQLIPCPNEIARRKPKCKVYHLFFL